MTGQPAGQNLNQTFVLEPHTAIRIWLDSISRLGQKGGLAIFCPSVNACDPYLQAAIDVLPRQHYRLRSFSGGAGFLLQNGAPLDICAVSGEDEAYAHAGRSWPAMIIDNPAGWSSQRMVHYLIALLRSVHTAPHLITVGSSLDSLYPRASDFGAVRKSDDSAGSDAVGVGVDFAGITRAVSGGMK